MFKFEKVPGQDGRLSKKKRLSECAYANDRYAASSADAQTLSGSVPEQLQDGISPCFGQMREIFGLPQNPKGEAKPVHRSAGGVSLPDYLREKFEKRSGLSMEDVRVHYQSDEPTKLDASAYAQGTDIYIGHGQERHLEHELGHIVQQKQGLVRPQKREKGRIINEDRELEQKADSISGTSSQQEAIEPPSVIQMKRDVFFPDVKEPHLHIHDGGCTFTGVGHNHKKLYDNSGNSINAIREVIQWLRPRGDANERSNARNETIIKYILEKICTDDERVEITREFAGIGALDCDALSIEMGMGTVGDIRIALADRAAYIEKIIKPRLFKLNLNELVMSARYPNEEELSNDIWKLYLDYKDWIEKETNDDPRDHDLAKYTHLLRQ